MSDVVEIRAENLGGESITKAVIKLEKAVGDSVNVDEVIFTMETEKTTMDLRSPVSGTISEILVNDDDEIELGTVLAKITKGQKSSSETTDQAKDHQVISQTTSDLAQKKDAPAATKIMANNKINPSQIIGAGKDGRITKNDVLKYLDFPNITTNAPKIDDSNKHDFISSNNQSDRREERVKMSKIRQVIASRLKESQNTAAILTTFNEIDMKNVMDLRAMYKESFEKKHGIKLGFMSFFIKATAMALKEVSAINAEISGDEIIYKYYYDIGVAVGTHKGLVVPVMRGVDQMSIAELEITLSSLAKKAKEGQLQVSDMSGATFTISNGGVYGSLFSTPIINPPQSGILGMHSIQDRAVVVGGSIEIRPMMYVALSYDHRIVDGQGAVSFLVKIKQYIEDPRRMVLEI